MPGILRLEAAAATDAGLERTVNEDRFHCDPAGGVFCVIDGVGGHAAGEQAAEIARRVLSERLGRSRLPPEARLRDAVTAANNEILRQSSTRPEWRGMTCVLTAVLVHDGEIVVGHIGDTRLYKLRRGAMQKLTRDHSPVGEREDDNELSELQAMRHPRRNEVYRDVGSERHNPGDAGFIDVLRAPFEEDAALLLCSDGLTDCVTTREIAGIVEDLAGDPGSVVQALVGAANRAGGRDNVTIVYVEGARFAAAEDTRELVARRGSRGDATERASDPRPDAHAKAGERGRWRVLILLVLLLVTLGFSGYAVRRGLTPVDFTGGALRLPRTVVVHPTGSIAAGLAEARAGDEVIVEPGEYRDQLVLKSGVRVRSRIPRAATIRLPGGAAESAAAVVAADIEDAEVSGFRIVGDAATPLGTGVLVRNAAVLLADLEVTGSRAAAVEFSGGAGGTLLASHVHDNPGTGLVVRNGASPRVAHNLFRRNGTSPQSAGAVFVEPDTDADVRENVFDGVSPALLAVPNRRNAGELARENVFLPRPEPAGRDREAAPARTPQAGQPRGTR
ncbi:MAG TPA: protein phosphatase 2C domain-containing protein [Vicinamibacterales bacterium]|nr:protein phosphatase 2C domain-containing protein [Vicinamibacterales bacterium]